MSTMDVRCERCKTEYEFDDARITEAGVTVKCTSCGHVFKVKKKALVVTVPVKPGENAEPVAAAAVAPAPAPAPAREWKVRQANGNVFTFKELTTLQKWIVERKVSRDDEISLTGETWKRLGNIAELASFFQVVEEAQKAAELQALQRQPAPVPLAQPVAQAPALPPPPSSPPASRTPVPAPAPVLVQDEPPQAPLSRAVGNEPRFVGAGAKLDARAEPSEDELEAAGLKKKSSGAGRWLGFLAVLVALGGLAYYGYFYWYLPQHPESQNLLPFGPVSVLSPAADAGALVDAGAPGAEAALGAGAALKAAPGATPDAAAVAAEPEEAAGEPDAGPALAAADTSTSLDAGAAEEVDAGVAAAEEPAQHRQRRDFDYWLEQGDKLRMRERVEAALEAYGKAADLGPSRAEPVAGRGLAFLDLGHKPQAEAAFREALRLNPRYAVAVMGLAETYRAMGRRQEAISYYQRYLEILPDGPEARVAQAAIKRLKE